MAYRTKILTFFAAFGFFMGIVIYGILDWLTVNNLLKISLMTIQSPWFTAGIAGAILSILLLIAVDRLTRK